jgi:hypothetical protein
VIVCGDRLRQGNGLVQIRQRLFNVFDCEVGVSTVEEVVGVVTVELCGHVEVLEAHLVLFHAQEGKPAIVVVHGCSAWVAGLVELDGVAEVCTRVNRDLVETSVEAKKT